MDISSSIFNVNLDEFEYSSPHYGVDHFLTRYFRDANLLLKDFNYNLSQLDRRDLTNFIQLVFEPEFLKLEQELLASDLYIYKTLFPIFRSFTSFVPIPEYNSVYYNCRGHIGSLRIHVCEKPLFDDDGVLLCCAGDSKYKTYLRINGLKIKL